MFAKWEITKHYEKPVQKLREAAEKVANGDFSVYVPPMHTSEKLDYLDAMILDFNKTVEELGSAEGQESVFTVRLPSGHDKEENSQ